MPDKNQAGEPVKINKDGHIEPTNDGQIEINKDIAGDRLKPTDELAPLFEGESIESILLRKHLILKLQDNKITEIDREDAIYLAMHEHSAPYIKRCAELEAENKQSMKVASKSLLDMKNERDEALRDVSGLNFLLLEQKDHLNSQATSIERINDVIRIQKEVIEKYKAQLQSANERADKLVETLKKITEGKGRFNTDPLKHADNCIQDMIALANEAILAYSTSQSNETGQTTQGDKTNEG